MNKAIAVLALAGLAGCGGPIWPFGGGGRDPAPAAPVAVATPLVDQVVSLEAAPTPSGVIVSAVGLPPTQGFWNAELARVPAPDPSVIALEFRLLPPLELRRVGTRPSREVLAGTGLSNQDLAGVRTITVRAARNAASVRR